MSKETINIKIVYVEAEPQQQGLSVRAGLTVGEVLAEHPWCLAYQKKYASQAVVGIFGKLVSMKQVLQDGDRLELYLPLHCDPMVKRRLQSRKCQY